VVFSTYKPNEVLESPENELTGYGFLRGGPALAILDLDAGAPWRTTVPAPAVTYQFGPEMACLDEDSEPAPSAAALLFYSLSDSTQGLRLYDLATDAWSTPVPAPSDRPFPSGNLVSAVWTGREVLFLVGSAEPALAYDPTRESWRTLDNAPRADVVFWDGSAVIGYGRDESPRAKSGAFRYIP
jgi:hypothetical protein